MKTKFKVVSANLKAWPSFSKAKWKTFGNDFPEANIVTCKVCNTLNTTNPCQYCKKAKSD